MLGAPLVGGFFRGLVWLCPFALLAVANADAVPTNAPLPAVDGVLQRIVARMGREPVNDQAFLGHYAFTRTKRTDTLDGKGKLQKRDDREIKYIPPVAVKPRHIEDFGETGRPAEAAKDLVAEGRGRALEKRDFQLNQELLQKFTFKVTGREIQSGRPTLVLEFQPRGGKLPEKNFKDKFVNKAAGRVWVDEAEAVVAKVALRLSEEVSVIGGLVGNVKQGRYGFERARTEEGFWFTRTVDWRIEGRQFFSKKVMEYHEEKKDVRRVERH
ncbi:MAG: hypothetical protein HZA89_03085 [Verrucomicrobia bacterium]|nr:hypothetical protein [Verrucomicrobiota bacterium]